ncbi:uridine phosphorylase 1-like isoform X2 [Ptychodera flava]
MDNDILFHFGLSTTGNDLPKMFGDVKFVCCGGSTHRMETFANYMLQELGMELPTGQSLSNICSTDRYVMYKVGPVLSINHGIGMPSMSIMLHEIIKLMHYAGCTDVVFFRIGTSGGLGMKPGTVVISEEAVNYKFQPVFQLPILGEMKSWPTTLSKEVAEEVQSCCLPGDDFDAVIKKTLSTDDFYEGQGRLDGAFCEFTVKDKMDYLQSAHDNGVGNVEMESSCFAAMTNRANIKAGVVCVTLIDRLEGDQLSTPANVLHHWEERAQQLVARYILKKLKQHQQQQQRK